MQTMAKQDIQKRLDWRKLDKLRIGLKNGKQKSLKVSEMCHLTLIRVLKAKLCVNMLHHDSKNDNLDFFFNKMVKHGNRIIKNERTQKFKRKKY